MKVEGKGKVRPGSSRAERAQQGQAVNSKGAEVTFTVAWQHLGSRAL